ncbi:hypothetical protein PAMA_017734 [Pampus argenteus]
MFTLTQTCSRAPAGTVVTSDLLLTRSVFILQVSGGTVRDLLAGLRSVGESRALSVLEEALCCHDDEMSGEALCAQVQDLKVDVRIDSGVCVSGVELSTA